MRFKTSCFNGPVLKNQIRRFWPLAVTVLGAVTVLLLFQVISGLQQRYSYDRWDFLLRTVYETSHTAMYLTLCGAFLSAALTFRHIHNRKETQFYLSLPLTRRGMYLTSWASGFLLIALPEVVGVLISVFVSCAMGGGVLAVPLLELLGACLALLLCFYAMSVLSCVLAGQTFGALLLYGGMNFGFYLAVTGIAEVAGMFMPGLHMTGIMEEITAWLTPVQRLSDACNSNDVYNGFREPWVFVIYGVAGAVLTVLAGLLYEKRPAEKAGETIAFRWVAEGAKTYGAVLVALGCFAVTVWTGLFQERVAYWVIVVLALVFFAVGYMAAEMVVQKSFRVLTRKTVTRCGVLMLVIFALMGAGKLDAFGTVGWIPDAGRVEKAVVRYNYSNEVEVAPEDAVELHQTVLDNQDYLTNNSYHSTSGLCITYTMDNGRVVERQYMLYHTGFLGDVVKNEPIMEKVYQLLRRPAYNYQTWFYGFDEGVTEDTLHYADVTTVYSRSEVEGTEFEGYILDFVNTDERNVKGLSTEEAVGLYQAICADIEEGNMDPNALYTRGEGKDLGYVSFECYPRAYRPSDGTRSEYMEAVMLQYNGVALYPEMTNTMAYLEKELDIHLVHIW